MGKGIIASKVFDKYWETVCGAKIIRHWFPNDDLVVFCNGDMDKLLTAFGEDRKLVNEFVAVKDYPGYFKDIEKRSQGTLSLECAVGKYVKEKNYDFVLSNESDEWFVSKKVLERVEDIRSGRCDMVMEYYSRHIYYATFIYNGRFDLFSDADYVFYHLYSNAERTAHKIILLKEMEYLLKHDTRFLPHYLIRNFKFGYVPNFGTIHEGSEKRPEAKANYAKFYDEKTNALLDGYNINQPICLGV